MVMIETTRFTSSLVINCVFTADIYVGCISYEHKVASDKMYIAICSTTVETGMCTYIHGYHSDQSNACCHTGNPEAELAPAYAALGPILEKFVSVVDLHVPVNPAADAAAGIYVSSVRVNVCALSIVSHAHVCLSAVLRCYH